MGMQLPWPQMKIRYCAVGEAFMQMQPTRQPMKVLQRAPDHAGTAGLPRAPRDAPKLAIRAFHSHATHPAQRLKPVFCKDLLLFAAKTAAITTPGFFQGRHGLLAWLQ